MEIVLSRSATYIPLWKGNSDLEKEKQIVIDFDYITAEEKSMWYFGDAISFASIARTVFREKVKKIHNLKLNIDGQDVEPTAENVLKAPDLYPFFSEVSAHIMQASQLDKDTKKK